jgi:hypothetical protein
MRPVPAATDVTSPPLSRTCVCPAPHGAAGASPTATDSIFVFLRQPVYEATAPT